MTPKRPGVAIVYLTLALTTLLYLLAKPTLSSLGGNIFITLAQIAALLGTVLFAFSFILASRTYLIEEAFGGLDRAYRAHHQLGVWSFSLLCTHLVCVLIGYTLNGVPVFGLMIANLALILGELGLVTMGAVILTIMFAKIKYQNFVLLQKFFAIPYAFGIYHLLIIPSDVARYQPLRAWMIAIVFLGAVSWIYRELFYRLLAPQKEYAVKAARDQGAEITEIALLPKTSPIVFKPGQFAYFLLHSKAVSPEAHPFSFSSAPGDQELRFAAKRLGDFTNELGKVAPGDAVTVYGPFGKFFSELDPAAENIFIAGGIGITPFMSALRARLVGERTILFYSTRGENDRAFTIELQELAAAPGAYKLHLHESDRRGYLTADIVAKRAGGLTGKKIFICGPAGLMTALKKQFRALGVPDENIIFEMFNY